MLLSRTLARARIARGIRPGAGAAWLPVAADAALTVLVLVLAYRMAEPWLTGLALSPLTMGLLLFVLLYIPFHGLLVLSTIWAVRSRWTDDENDTGQTGLHDS